MQIIATTIAVDLVKSCNFFSSLGWKIIKKNTITYACEKGIILELNTDKKSRPGLKVYGAKPSTLAALRKITFVEEIHDAFILNDPAGNWIYLMKDELDFTQEQIPETGSILGNFAGLSIECVDAISAIRFYETLNMETTMGTIENGWQALKLPGGIGVSIMKANQCPHSFTNPSFTYFNSGKNEQVIAKIRERNIAITEEITAFHPEKIVDNIIIHEPGGYGFFIFND